MADGAGSDSDDDAVTGATALRLHSTAAAAANALLHDEAESRKLQTEVDDEAATAVQKDAAENYR